MGQEYTARHIAALHSVNLQTVHNWSQEFANYLGPKANPGPRRPRLFTTEDMTVISLIAEMKKGGAQFQDIHAALAAGQRGEGIATPPEELDGMINGQDRAALVAQNQDLQRKLDTLRKELDKARELELQNARLQERITWLTEQLEKAEARAKEKDTEADQLNQLVGELRGELKAVLRQSGQSDK